jgi:hypothetical protein
LSAIHLADVHQLCHKLVKGANLGTGVPEESCNFLTQVEKLLGWEEREKMIKEMNEPLSVVDRPGGARATRQVHFRLPQLMIIIKEDLDIVAEKNNITAFKWEVAPCTMRWHNPT